MKPHHKLAASLLLAMALIASSCSGGGPDGQDPTGFIEVVTVERLSDGVAAAAAALLDAPGVAVTRTRTDEAAVRWAWVTSRANGDFVSIRRQEPTDPDGGLPSGTLATAFVDGSFFIAGIAASDSQPWSLMNRGVVMDRSSPFVGVGLDLAGMADGVLFVPLQDPSAGEVTRQDTVDGGVVWSWTAPFHGGTVVQDWNVHPDGHLRSYTLRYLGDIQPPDVEFLVQPTTAPELARSPFISPAEEHSDFVILHDPAPITAPDVGTVLDLEVAGVPADLLPEDT